MLSNLRPQSSDTRTASPAARGHADSAEEDAAAAMKWTAVRRPSSPAVRRNTWSTGKEASPDEMVPLSVFCGLASSVCCHQHCVRLIDKRYRAKQHFAVILIF